MCGIALNEKGCPCQNQCNNSGLQSGALSGCLCGQRDRADLYESGNYLVDDGSPDRCPAMCDAWAEKGPPHQGHTPQKRRPFCCAAMMWTGMFVQETILPLVDSDDRLELDYYATRLWNRQQAEKCGYR